MNVVIAYLDTMFSTYPQTPRLLEAKAELQGMMEDAYASLIAEGRTENEAVGQVIRDFGNLEELAPVLGISADLGPADAGASTVGASRSPYPTLTLAEAQGYATAQERNRFRVAGAVALFVLSPAALIGLDGAAESGVLGISEDAALALGLGALALLAIAGVLTLIGGSQRTAPFKHISEGRFTPHPEATRWTRDLAARHEPARVRSLQIAITLWILAPMPLIAFVLLGEDSSREDAWTGLGVVVVLALVAAGLTVLLPRSWAHSVNAKISDAAAAPEDQRERRITDVIASIYWPLVTVGYLAWSLLAEAWEISWIIWPLAAVLFGAVAAGTSSIERYRRSAA